MYNDHQAILAAEHAKAVAEEEALARQAEMKNRIMQGREENHQSTREYGYADEVGSGDEEEEDENENEEGGEESGKKKKKQRRKTEKERKKRQANVALEVSEHIDSYNWFLIACTDAYRVLLLCYRPKCERENA